MCRETRKAEILVKVCQVNFTSFALHPYGTHGTRRPLSNKRSTRLVLIQVAFG